MNIGYFNEYLHYKNDGLRAKATEYVLKFIDSFENYEEKESWTLEYLPKLEINHHSRIRHELFEEIIFPVLLEGYNNKDISLMIWLVKLEQNIIQNKKIYEKLNNKSSIQIIKECYEIDPNNEEVINIFLELEIRGINFSIHEWPAGILWGMDGATVDQCEILLEEIPFIKKLAKGKEKKYLEYINDYERKVKEYKKRLEK